MLQWLADANSEAAQTIIARPCYKSNTRNQFKNGVRVAAPVYLQAVRTAAVWFQHCLDSVLVGSYAVILQRD